MALWVGGAMWQEIGVALGAETGHQMAERKERVGQGLQLQGSKFCCQLE